MFVEYEHTQPGTVIRWSAAAPLLIGAWFIILSALSSSWGFLIPAGIAWFIAAVIFILFHALTVMVTRTEIQLSFGVGLIRKRFPLSEIKRVSAERNAWWYGWGIRYTPHGWLFNVSGLNAVEIEYVNGRKYRIGTDEPQKLLTAIEEALADSR